MEIAVPAATRRFIIGTKGKNLQQIEVKSGVRINFPPRKDDEGEPAEDETVPVTLVGDAAGIAIAKTEIDKIVGEKVSKKGNLFFSRGLNRGHLSSYIDSQADHQGRRH